ncbi:MAG: hypothetical protein IJ106_16495, partial [Parasporobacterium sp.]|nr:hypothetical protein [Parasporobacterium sp.]
MPANKAAYKKKNIRLDAGRAAGRATAAFVLGIASIVLCGIPLMLAAAVVGLSLEKESERWGYHQLQFPAKVLCIIGTILSALAIV